MPENGLNNVLWDGWSWNSRTEATHDVSPTAGRRVGGGGGGQQSSFSPPPPPPSTFPPLEPFGGAKTGEKSGPACQRGPAHTAASAGSYLPATSKTSAGALAPPDAGARGRLVGPGTH